MALSSSSAISPHTNIPAKEDSTTVKVKQETPEDAEIKELAAKMVEAHKSKLAASAAARNSHNNNVAAACGQTNIQNYMVRQTANLNKDSNSTKKPDNKEREPTIDEESARGRFGWETFGKCFIPYIFRRGVKYVAVRMVEMKLLNKFLTRVHPDLYTCTCIRSYFITEAEARLLNEINIRHSEGQFGRDSFTSKDSVVLLEDAIEFYKFLEVAYSKLLLHKNEPSDKCGFIRINGEAVVPFTVRDGEKYVPLFYFEGETDNLKLKAKQLEGWDLAYLKFCCKVQGIRNELFASDTCSVISLNDIKSYFPSSTLFQDYWPGKVMSPLILDSVSTGPQQGAWTKQPGGAPTPVVKSTQSTLTSSHQVTSKPTNDSQMKMLMPNSHVSAAVAHQHQIPAITTVNSTSRTNVCQAPTSSAAAINGWSGLVGGQPAYQNSNQSMRLGSVPLPVLTTTANPVNRQWQPVRMRTTQPYYGQVQMTGSATISPTQPTLSSSTVSHPPPLVRGTVESSTMGSTTTFSTATAGLTIPHCSIIVGGARQPLTTMMGASSAMHATTTVSSVSSTRSIGRDPISSAKYPPPLIPAVSPHNPQVSQATPQTSVRYGYSTASDVIDLSPPPRSPHRSQHQAHLQNQMQHHTQRLQSQVHQMQTTRSMHPSVQHTSESLLLHQQRLQTSQQQLQQNQHQQNQHQQSQHQQNQHQQSQHQQNQHQQSQHQQNQHQQNQLQQSQQHHQNQQQLQQRKTQQETQYQHLRQLQNQQQNQQRQQQQQQQHVQPRQQEMQQRVQQNNQTVRSGTTSVHAGGGSNGDLSKQDSSTYKLMQIPETQATGQHMPYKVSKAYVEGLLIPCINFKPYIYTELLMTLPDLTSHFFSNVSCETLRQVLQEVLGVSLFRGNRLQMQVLRSSGKCRSTNEILPLVQVRDVMQYMPQLKYMLGRGNPDESLSKRQRTS
ncbi:hypothetical protein J437_LFUL001804 [Ladona fulva]|uniref:Uncharacterized protein n=1 Tax=Ladona fulva TaxID=123851 RepID=A0A8K0JWR8_LADFU|nr:hypothetical protein J437_LFUL001804 [Ladona fulva]